jgi:hypothetical protein
VFLVHFFFLYLNYCLDPNYRDASKYISAKPVQLHGTPKDPPSVVALWEKFEQENGYTWPPHCGFRKMSAKEPLSHVDAFMTLPVAVAALKLD